MKNRILALIVLTCFGISGLSGCGRTGQDENSREESQESKQQQTQQQETQLVEFKDMLEAMAVSGINKPNAKKSLIEYTEDIIKRLEKEIYTT